MPIRGSATTCRITPTSPHARNCTTGQRPSPVSGDVLQRGAPLAVTRRRCGRWVGVAAAATLTVTLQSNHKDVPMKHAKFSVSDAARGPRPLLARSSLLLLAGALFALPALAVDKSQQRQAEQRFQEERAVCNSGRSNQDRSSCLMEAQSAYAEARRGVLGDGETPQPGNLSQRCQALSGDEQNDCMARMNGQGSTTGSAQGGGIYRELKTFKVQTPVAAPAAVPAAVPASGAQPGTLPK